MIEFQPAVRLAFEGASLWKGRLPSLPGTRWIPALNHELRDDAVKNGVIVVPIDGVLKEVAAGQRRFFWPEFNVYVPEVRHEHSLQRGQQ